MIESWKQKLKNETQIIDDTRRENLPSIQSTKILANELNSIVNNQQTIYNDKLSNYNNNFSGFIKLFSCCFCCPCGCSDAKKSYDMDVKPELDKLNELITIENSAKELVKTVDAAFFEEKKHYNGGCYMVYNENTGKTEYKEAYNDTICGVYNPVAKMVEWNKKYVFLC